MSRQEAPNKLTDYTFAFLEVKKSNSLLDKFAFSELGRSKLILKMK